MFHDTNVIVTCHGRLYLGAPLGSDVYMKEYVQEKFNPWIGELQLLMDIAKSQPHVAYAAFTHGYLHKFSYLCRSTPNIAPHLDPLEEFLSTTLIPALTGKPPPDTTVHDLSTLPTRLLQILQSSVCLSMWLQLPLQVHWSLKSIPSVMSTCMNALLLRFLRRPNRKPAGRHRKGKLHQPSMTCYRVLCRGPWTWSKKRVPRAG